MQRDRILEREREREWKFWTESVCNCDTFNKCMEARFNLYF
jgi:hypothetical protein